MNRRGVCLGLALGLVAVVFLAGPPAKALQWTQTSQADFLAGQMSGVNVTASGELVLASGPGTWSREGVVLDIGTNAPYDSVQARCPFVLRDLNAYRMWYMGFDGTSFRMLYATSPDGVTWTGQGVAVNVGTPPMNFVGVQCPAVLKEGSVYKMWFSATTAGIAEIYYATSPDATAWTISPTPALGLGPAGAWDDSDILYVSVVRDATGRYDMYYTGYDGTAGGWDLRIGLATSMDGVTFTRKGTDPVLDLGATGSWDDRIVEAPSVLEGSPWRMWYSGAHTTTYIGEATSVDGENWSKAPGNPAFTGGPAGSWDGTSAQLAQVLRDGADTFLYYSGGDGTNLRIGRARLTPTYVQSGWWESAVFDSGAPGTTWTRFTGNGTVNAVTQVWVRTRSGDTPVPDASWSPWTAPQSPASHPITSPRSRYLQVRVEMSTGNVQTTPFFGDFTVDYRLNSAAAPTPLSPVGGIWVNTTGLRLAWNYSDPEGDPQSGYRAQVSGDPGFSTVEADSSPVASADASWRTPPLADGGWYWRVETADAYGVWSPYSAPAFVRIDTVPPVTSLGFTLPPDTLNGIPWVNASNRIVLAATDAGSGVAASWYSLNGGPRVPYAGPFPLAAHGLSVLEYGSTDAAGNAEAARSASLLVDDAPAVAPASPAAGAWTNASALTLGWTYADPDGDPASGYEVQLASDPAFATVVYTSGPLPGAATSHTFLGVADGTYAWRARAADAYGVWSPFSAARAVSLDTVPPAAAYAFRATLGTIDGRPWIAPGTMLNLSASDAGSGVAEILYSIDGSGPAPYTSEVALGLHGVHTLAYWAVDRAGNEGPHETADFVVDRAPEAANRAPPDGSWATAPPVLAWNFTDADGDGPGGYEVQVSPDGFSTIAAGSGAVRSGDTSWQAPALPDGTYEWRVRVQDVLGAWSSWSTSTEVRIDATPPLANALHGGAVIPASSGVFGLSVGDSIALNATDAGSGVARIEVSLDGSDWTTYASPIVFETEGTHVLAFRAVDVAGNVGPTRVLVVDATYPFNWTPVLAIILAVLIALVGALLVSRRKDPEARPSKGLAWAVMALPGTILEVVVGVYSTATGELATPPWLGAGLLIVVLAAVLGSVSIALGLRAFARPPEPAAEAPPPPSPPAG